jgi:pSer/pThr/pTyr-binding forkhead associated (FHA) protein
MAKLVILTPGLTGRAHELSVDRTTIGRVEDNIFQIPEASVSSHHCEVQLRGNEFFIQDLNSTNGTFINGEKISEGALKPGQTLRLGNVELRLEGVGAAAASASAQVKRQVAAPSGVSLSELESGGRPPGFDTSKEFSKKRNKAGIYFWLGFGIVIALIAVLLFIAYQAINTPHK